MAKAKQKDPFWTSYSDLMTSLFFVMLVLFIICFIRVGHQMAEIKSTNEKLDSLLHDANADKEQLEQVLQLDSLFSTLSNNTTLAYDNKGRMFYAKALVGKEIFYPNTPNIKQEYIGLVDSIGNDIDQVLHKLNQNSQFHYQLVIEGTAAIPWRELKTANRDNQDMYRLSYERSLTLYNKWKEQRLDLRKYNTEIIIAGSGFNGNNRDNKVEENNKRFIIQIIPKIMRPEPKDTAK